MSEINNKINELADKIYKEGLEKAELESEKILALATQKKQEIINSAKDEAEKVISKARREADEIKRTAENEIMIKGRQLVSDLKNEIRYLLKQKLIDKSIETSFTDQGFLKSLILEIAGYWKDDEKLELVLPKKLESKLDHAFKKGILDHVVNLNITFNHKLKDGFRIARDGDAYQITFSEEDFKELFGDYLKETTNNLLFNT